MEEIKAISAKDMDRPGKAPSRQKKKKKLCPTFQLEN